MPKKPPGADSARITGWPELLKEFDWINAFLCHAQAIHFAGASNDTAKNAYPLAKAQQYILEARHAAECYILTATYEPIGH